MFLDLLHIAIVALSACLFAPDVKPMVQALINPLTASNLFIGGPEIVDNALLALLWTVTDGHIIAPLIGYAFLVTRLPLHAAALLLPLVRQAWLNRRCPSRSPSIFAYGLVTLIVYSMLTSSEYSATTRRVVLPSSRVTVGDFPLLSTALLQPAWYLRSLSFLHVGSYFEALLLVHPFLHVVPLTLRFWCEE